MSTLQKVIKYLAIAFALFLTVTIVGGIFSAVGLFSGSFVDDTIREEQETYSVTSQIQNLDMEINAAAVSIKEGEVFSVESNLKHLKVEEKGNRLIVKETGKLQGNYKGAVLNVYVPNGTVFEYVNFTTGAGSVNVENLSAKTLDMELGAGEVFIDSLIATESADIEGGAGRITISDGALQNLEMEMGVGQMNLTSSLTGNCSLDQGIGESNITLIGNREDYKLDLEKGIGNISIDGKNVSGYKDSGNGRNRVEIHGGIGEIHVKFMG